MNRAAYRVLARRRKETTPTRPQRTPSVGRNETRDQMVGKVKKKRRMTKEATRPGQRRFEWERER